MIHKGRGKFDAESTVALDVRCGERAVNPCRQKLVRTPPKGVPVMGYGSSPCGSRYTVKKPLPGTNPTTENTTPAQLAGLR